MYGARLCRGIGRAAMCADDEDEEEEEEASEEKEARAVRGCVNVRLPSVAMDLCISDGLSARGGRERERVACFSFGRHARCWRDMAATPRPSKRMRTDPPEPDNDPLQLAPTASAGPVDVPNQPSSGDKGKQKQLEPPPQAETEGRDDNDSDAQSNLEEMERIYDMLAEDYHDSQSSSFLSPLV